MYLQDQGPHGQLQPIYICYYQPPLGEDGLDLLLISAHKAGREEGPKAGCKPGCKKHPPHELINIKIIKPHQTACTWLDLTHRAPWFTHSYPSLCCFTFFPQSLFFPQGISHCPAPPSIHPGKALLHSSFALSMKGDATSQTLLAGYFFNYFLQRLETMVQVLHRKSSSE